MKNSDEKIEKRDFPKNWKPIARVPKECLQDIGDIRLEYIGELTPRSKKCLPVITARVGDWNDSDEDER